MAKLFNDIEGKRNKTSYKPTKIYRRETKVYPSRVSDNTIAPKADNKELLEVSSKYTIAPAYNKGAYQVISSNSIEDIGK